MEETQKNETPPQVRELNEYIDGLHEKLEITYKARVENMKLELAAFILHVSVLLLLPGFLSLITWLLFWGLYLYGALSLGRKHDLILGEIEGCFTTLEILGYIEKGAWTGRKRRKSSSLFAPLVKRWNALKEKMQKEPYGATPVQAPAY